MVERRRLLLAFLDRSGGNLSKEKLMLWLFLLQQEQGQALGRSAFYDFVPHKSEGWPYSFQVCRDVRALQEVGLVTPDRLSVIPAARTEMGRRGLRSLPSRASGGVDAVLHAYGAMTTDQLRRVVDPGNPWCGDGNHGSIPPALAAVYTVGYEGRTIDGLLSHLLRSGIRQLIDVRRNALSRKYGFSGRTLARLCGEVEMGYVHVPELGIPATMRTTLTSRAAYDRLFDLYEARILTDAAASINVVARLCMEKASALMCFEASPRQCHRGRLALRVEESSGLAVQHL